MRAGAWRIWTVGVGLCLLHFLLRVGIGLDSGTPDFLVIGFLLLSRELGMGTAAALGMGLGLAEDASSVLAFGANAFALTVLGMVGSRSREYFVGDSVLFLFGFFAGGVWLRQSLHWVMSGSARPAAGSLLLVDVPISSVYTAAVGVLVVIVTGAWWDSVR